MANYKVPRVVEIIDELPLNATGKVEKQELRARRDALIRHSQRFPGPGQQAAGDDQPLDLVGALADHHQRGVAVVALDRQLGGVADAAVDAHRLGGQLERGLAGEELGHAGLDVAAQPGRLALGGVCG